jgi:hypothetical protein
MPLPESWVDKLFRKLAATYGQSFQRQYDGVPIDDVKANWAIELACFQQNPQAIARGLELLPTDRAPTVLQFRELCKSQASNEMLRLPAPPSEPVSPEVVAATKAAFQRKDARGWRDWATALKRRNESGEKLTRFQIDCYRSVIDGAQRQEAA